jgi:hypothetical protein
MDLRLCPLYATDINESAHRYIHESLFGTPLGILIRSISCLFSDPGAEHMCVTRIVNDTFQLARRTNEHSGDLQLGIAQGLEWSTIPRARGPHPPPLRTTLRSTQSKSSQHTT